MGEDPPADPYAGFGLRLTWEGRVVAGFSRVSELAEGAGGEGPVVLEEGLTLDRPFRLWCGKIWDYQGSGGLPGGGVSIASFRRDILLEARDPAGEILLACTILRCWPSRFAVRPESEGDAVAIERLVLLNQGWEQQPLP